MANILVFSRSNDVLKAIRKFSCVAVIRTPGGRFDHEFAMPLAPVPVKTEGRRVKLLAT